MTARQTLPPRRRSITEKIAFGQSEVNPDGITVQATMSFDDKNEPRELFLAGGKEGSDLRAALDDAAVVISVALQHGVPLEALVKSTRRVQTSVLGAALQWMLKTRTDLMTPPEDPR